MYYSAYVAFLRVRRINIEIKYKINLGEIRIFWEATGKYLDNKNFFEYRKLTTFAGKFPNSEKRLRLEVKILFKNYNFFGIKIKKSGTDSN